MAFSGNWIADSFVYRRCNKRSTLIVAIGFFYFKLFQIYIYSNRVNIINTRLD